MWLEKHRTYTAGDMHAKAGRPINAGSIAGKNTHTIKSFGMKIVAASALLVPVR
jgi:hypothetical protein